MLFKRLIVVLSWLISGLSGLPCLDVETGDLRQKLINTAT